MKEGGLSTWSAVRVSGSSVVLWVASGAHLSIVFAAGGQATLEAGSEGASPEGPSGGQTKSGASRSGSEGLVVGEDMPDRFGELSGDVDLGDLGAALFAQPLLGAPVALVVGRMAQGVHGGFEHRPAQVLRALLGQRAAAIALTGLVHARAQAGVATQLLRRQK